LKGGPRKESIVESLRKELDPATIQQLSDHLGADPAAVSKAATLALPMLLGGLSRNASVESVERWPEAAPLHRLCRQKQKGRRLTGALRGGSHLTAAFAGYEETPLGLLEQSMRISLPPPLNFRRTRD
jgi:hypothetical protein